MFKLQDVVFETKKYVFRFDSFYLLCLGLLGLYYVLVSSSDVVLAGWLSIFVLCIIDTLICMEKKE